MVFIFGCALESPDNFCLCPSPDQSNQNLYNGPHFKSASNDFNEQRRLKTIALMTNDKTKLVLEYHYFD